MKEQEKEEEEKQKKYIPVYKKGYRSKTYHPKNSHSFFSIKHKNKKYLSKTQQNKKIIKHYDKVLVFDLDETLGSFSELQWIWNAMTNYSHSKESQKSLHSQKAILKTLIDIYPEFLRPGILHILEYLAQKKKKGECIAIFIYTNNQHPPPWTECIIDYFNQYIEEKTNNRPFFDQIIPAFKIGQEKIEWMRTSNDKSYEDFIKCSILPKHTEICFVDNTYFHSMIHPKVYYIQPKSYQHTLSIQDTIDRFIFAETSGILDEFFPIAISSFPSASSFLFFSNTTQSQKQTRKIMVRKFIEQTMEQFVHNKQLRLQQSLKNNSITIKPTPLIQNTAQQNLEIINIDLYVSQKLLDFIREFFILTTYSHILTRKHKPITEITDLKTTT